MANSDLAPKHMLGAISARHLDSVFFIHVHVSLYCIGASGLNLVEPVLFC